MNNCDDCAAPFMSQSMKTINSKHALDLLTVTVSYHLSFMISKASGLQRCQVSLLSRRALGLCFLPPPTVLGGGNTGPAGAQQI